MLSFSSLIFYWGNNLFSIHNYGPWVTNVNLTLLTGRLTLLSNAQNPVCRHLRRDRALKRAGKGNSATRRKNRFSEEYVRPVRLKQMINYARLIYTTTLEGRKDGLHVSTDLLVDFSVCPDLDLVITLPVSRHHRHCPRVLHHIIHLSVCLSVQMPTEAFRMWVKKHLQVFVEVPLHVNDKNDRNSSDAVSCFP